MTEMSPAEKVYFAALECDTPGARAAYLDAACEGRPELRARVDRLLAARPRVGDFLEPDPAADATRITGVELPPEPPTLVAASQSPQPLTSDYGGIGQRGGDYAGGGGRAGAVVARKYSLVEVIGEGGMGSVWRAKQTEPVKRFVAIKLIKPGMDSRQVLARFDAERQALALMDHPNIARIYDGGVTDAGQPFFVMELVNGVPLTEYCDSGRLTVVARLELFVQVCQAVQHAHQKGIIHRDLKPGNVLVTEIDGRPTPRVIDFGVAKATEQKLTDMSFNDAGAIVGTPVYMSPEQADPTSMDIDTRTDVYALGVVLYELLTGSPPIDGKQFGRGAILEMLRMVREVEPPRPSTKLSTSDALPNIAANRSIEPSKLSKLLRGELDCVVMKALEKDRTRRYDTASGLARDIQRYLADEVVEARPPTRGYRLRKFIRRNKVQVIAAGLVVLTLSGGVIGTTWQAIRAETARDNEAAERRRAETALLKATDVLDAMVSEVAGESLATQPVIREEQKAFLGMALTYYREFAAAGADDESGRERVARAAHRVGLIEDRLGRKPEAAAALRTARDLYAALSADFPAQPGYRRNGASASHSLGIVLKGLGQRDESEAAYRAALAEWAKLAAASPANADTRAGLARTHYTLGNLLREMQRWADAERQLRAALAIHTELAKAATTAGTQDLARTHHTLGLTLFEAGRPAEALEEYRAALALQEPFADGAAPEPRRELGITRNSLGNLLKYGLRDVPGAVEQYRKVVDIQRRLVAEYPSLPAYRQELARTHNNLGISYKLLGDLAAADAEYRLSLDLRRSLAADFPAVPAYALDLGSSQYNFGLAASAGWRYPEAVEWFDRAVRTLDPAHAASPDDPAIRRVLRNTLWARASTYRELRRHAAAAADWDRVIALGPPAERDTFRALRVNAWANSGRLADAVAEVAELSKLPKLDASEWYDFACVYAVASGKIADKKTEYADRAMELLTQAVKAGYKNTVSMKEDTDLDPLRDRDDFKKLLADLEARFPPKKEVAPPPKVSK